MKNIKCCHFIILKKKMNKKLSNKINQSTHKLKNE